LAADKENNIFGSRSDPGAIPTKIPDAVSGKNFCPSEIFLSQIRSAASEEIHPKQFVSETADKLILGVCLLHPLFLSDVLSDVIGLKQQLSKIHDCCNSLSLSLS